MKIDSTYKPVSTPVTPRPTPKSASENASTAAEAVRLSPLAGMLTNEKPPVNSVRIQEIKDAIAQGKFKINPEVIASRLLDSARDLINNQRNT